MKEGKRMIYDEISFKAMPFQYELSFDDRVTLVRGNSGTGKTYMYNILSDLRLTEKYNKIKLFNYKTDNFHEMLAKCQDSFIVIDNADILLNDEDKLFINFNLSNQYMLFLRNCDGLNLSANSFTTLEKKNNVLSLKKEFSI